MEVIKAIRNIIVVSMLPLMITIVLLTIFDLTGTLNNTTAYISIGVGLLLALKYIYNTIRNIL